MEAEETRDSFRKKEGERERKGEKNTWIQIKSYAAIGIMKVEMNR